MPNKSKSENRKKKEINGFTVFLDDVWKEKRRQNLPVSKESLCGSARADWNRFDETEKARYKNRAKAMKAKLLADDSLKSDSFGRNVAELKKAAREEEEERERKRSKTKSFVLEALQSGNFQTASVVIVDFGIACMVEETEKFLPCEFGAVKFSLENGVMKFFHSLVNFGKIPLGYDREIRENLEKVDLESKMVFPFTNYLSMQANLKSLVEKKDGDLDPVFVLAEDMKATMSILEFICERAVYSGKGHNPFDVLYLDDLMLAIREMGPKFLESIGKSGAAWYLPETLMIEKVRSHRYDHVARTGCSIHEEAGNPVNCALGRAVHRALNICNLLGPFLSIEQRPGHHVPPIISKKTLEEASVKAAELVTKYSKPQELEATSSWLDDLVTEPPAGTGHAAVGNSAGALAAAYEPVDQVEDDEEDEDEGWSTVPSKPNRSGGWLEDLRRSLPSD